VFDLVIFDLDGTLVDTAPEQSDAVNDALETLGYAQVTEALVRDWIGHGMRELMLKALSHVADWSEGALCRSGAIASAMLVFAEHYAARCGTRANPIGSSRRSPRSWPRFARIASSVDTAPLLRTAPVPRAFEILQARHMGPHNQTVEEMTWL